MRQTPYGELTAFIAVAEQRNFTRAARRMGVSTGTLSQTIRSLEEKLGIRPHHAQRRADRSGRTTPPQT